jgi:hypothetical protein
VDAVVAESLPCSAGEAVAMSNRSQIDASRKTPLPVTLSSALRAAMMVAKAPVSGGPRMRDRDDGFRVAGDAFTAAVQLNAPKELQIALFAILQREADRITAAEEITPSTHAGPGEAA